MPALIDLRARYPELHAVRPGSPLAIRHYTLTNALGAGRAASLEGLRGRRSGLRPCDFPGAGLATWIGRVAGLETAPLPAELARHESRNHRLAWLALQQDGFLAAVAAAIGRHGAERVAVVMGPAPPASSKPSAPIAGAIPTAAGCRRTSATGKPRTPSRRPISCAGSWAPAARP